MFRKNTLFDYHWDVDKYKNNFDPEHWDLCRSFMVIHRTKFPEQKLAHLTEAFYQIGVYGSSYDPKTTRMVSALSVEVLDDFLNSHPGAMRHPFRKTIVASKVADETLDESSKKDSDKAKSGSIWDVTVDKSIIANVLVQSQMQSLLKGFIIIYDVTRESTMNDSKVGILEESFRRSKFGPCHWDKDETHNNLCPIRLSLKWKGTVLAEGEGSDDKTLRTRLAQAVLSKLSTFSHGIETKWSYYRDGRKPGLFDHMKPRRSEIYKSIPRSQFKAMEEITSYIDTFANSDSFTEIIFAMDFSNNEKAQLTEYITKSWGTRLTYRTVNKEGVKSKCETHLCIYHNRTGEELKRWLDKFGGENERYRLVPPGEHRRAGGCDNNVREVLTIDTGALHAASGIWDNFLERGTCEVNVCIKNPAKSTSCSISSDLQDKAQSLCNGLGSQNFESPEGDDLSELVKKVRNIKLKTKLNGAGKKRFRWLVLKGYRPEEARELAVRPMPTREERLSRRSKKRSLSEETLKKKIKYSGDQKTRTKSTQKYSRRVTGVKLGILHAKHPEKCLSTEEMEEVKKAILNAILKAVNDSVQPVFYGVYRKQGFLVLNCQDEETAEWVERSLELEGDLAVKVVPEVEIPRTRVLTAFFPGSVTYTTEKILTLLKVQNENMKATQWRVLKRMEKGSAVMLALAVDCVTASRLETDGPWAFYKFGKIELQLKKKARKH